MYCPLPALIVFVFPLSRSMTVTVWDAFSFISFWYATILLSVLATKHSGVMSVSSVSA